MKIYIAWIAAVNLLASCVPPVEPLNVPPALPSTYLNGTTDPLSIGDTGWQQLFLDPQLRALIGEALVANAGVNIAVQRVYEAQAQLRQTVALQRPNISGNLSTSYQRVVGKQPGGASSTETIAPTLVGATATAYDFDLFGSLRYATAAQRARVLA
jgi:outer membrane protein TolC